MSQLVAFVCMTTQFHRLKRQYGSLLSENFALEYSFKKQFDAPLFPETRRFVIDRFACPFWSCARSKWPIISEFSRTALDSCVLCLLLCLS